MATVRMKVKCVELLTFESSYQNKIGIGGKYKFNFVYGDKNPEHENTKFWEATPAGTFEVTINNQAAMKDIEVGKEYYLDLIKA